MQSKNQSIEYSTNPLCAIVQLTGTFGFKPGSRLVLVDNAAWNWLI